MAGFLSLAFYAIPVMTIAAAALVSSCYFGASVGGDISRNQAARRYGFTVLYPILAMVLLWAVVEWVNYQATGIFSLDSQAAFTSLQALFPVAVYLYLWIPMLVLNVYFWLATSEDQPSPPIRSRDGGQQ